MNIKNRVGERTEPWSTPALVENEVEVYLSNTTCIDRLLKKLAIHDEKILHTVSLDFA